MAQHLGGSILGIDLLGFLLEGVHWQNLEHFPWAVLAGIELAFGPFGLLCLANARIGL